MKSNGWRRCKDAWVLLLLVISQITLTAFIAPYLGGILYEVSPYTPFYVVIVATLLLSLVAFTKPLKER